MTRFVAVLALASPAAAQEFPAFEGAIKLDFEVDRVTDPPSGASRRTNGFVEVEALFGLRLTEALSIRAHLQVEPVREATGSGLFQGEAAFVQELLVNYEAGALAVHGGKFNPGFGIAWDAAPGIFGTDMAADYELTERLGAGLAYKLAVADAGTHRLALNVFTLDTTLLSESVGSRPVFGEPSTLRPRRFRESQGGAGNTGRLDSVSLTLDGGEFEPLPGLAYHLGYRHQGKGVDGVDDENGYVGALVYEIPLAQDIKLIPLVEYAHFDRFGGLDQTARYFTGAAALGIGPWTLSASTTIRRLEAAGADTRDWLRTASIAYAFSDELELSAGWARVQEAGERTTTLGVLLTYLIKF